MHGRQEVHLYHLDAGALAVLASASGDVEGESASLITAHLGIRRFLEEGADVAEHARERGWIGAWRTADRALVYLYELVNILYALYGRIRQRALLGAVEFLLEDGHQGLIDKGTLAGSGKAGNAYEASQREAHINALEVVSGGTAQREELAVSGPSDGRNFYAPLPPKVIQRKRLAALHKLLQRPVQAYPAAVFSRTGAHIHKPVGAHHGFCIVLHNHHGVAFVAERFK